MRRVVGYLLILVLFTSCGYKPTAIYTREVLGDKIFADVKTSLSDPENSVLIKDAINEAVISKFHSKLVSKRDLATATLDISIKSVKFEPIEYDTNGYVIAYKSSVILETNYKDKSKKEQVITTSGDYDFNIQTLSVISDSKRFNAIKEASQKAIDAFISQISIRGVKR